jgi:hypothetical protein
MMTDWRLNGQERYLKNKKIKHIEYKNQVKYSDHEHCEFCMEKISNYSDSLHEGYCTEDEYHWICENCYNDFKDLFNWTLL